MIYLDHHAAAPPCDAAIGAMEQARAEAWANPSSVHAAGRRARAMLDEARRHVAEALGASAADVVLVGGGTEACNMGVWGLGHPPPERVVTTRIEHPAVARAVAQLEHAGCAVVRLEVPGGRAPDADDLARAMEPGQRTLVAVGWINHETGTLLPVHDYAQACRRVGARLFVDATQAFGKRRLQVEDLGADAVAVASHKMGGPAGAGALWVRRGVDCHPLLAGGAQERGRRAGTPDVVAHAGFGAACMVVAGRLDHMGAIGALRDALEGHLVGLGAVVNGAAGPRVETVTSVGVPGWKGEVLVAALDLEGVCASSGAACSSGLSQASPVVAAMHPDEPWRATSALRLSLGPENHPTDVQGAKDAITRVVRRSTASSVQA
jgi:cysteine desulfurase